MILKRRIVQIGNSLGVRIPRVVLKELGWDEDTPINIEVKETEITITRSETAPKLSLFRKVKK